ncbi:hypothetical protein [Streptococcus gallolyticus]|uniref:hypothetical protein n=1 Tax=Streptococcus gallolyticus TaxID=315405 RepID=UPI000E42004A|nr:hypothetical protein [Streptococcus gallolyticus]RGC38183.1 hypothetical protein DXD73_08535 [Streptococcus gallolyticus]
MTIETKMLKTIREIHFDELKELISEYREIEKVIRTYTELHFELYVYDEVIMASDWVNKKLVELLEKRLEILESEINILGYTMQDEPKEWQYHVNVLRGENVDYE